MSFHYNEAIFCDFQGQRTWLWVGVGELGATSIPRGFSSCELHASPAGHGSPTPSISEALFF
jgi:hypothetical protein